MLITNLRHPRLVIKELAIAPGECWCAYGSGRSGLNEFLTLLEGRLGEVHADTLQLPENPAVISFSVQQEIFEEELRNDDSDFLDCPDPGTLAHEFLPAASLDNPLIDAFDMRASLATGYRQLSSGQSRKLLLLKAILDGADTVVLDSPYDGLDQQGCLELDHAFSHLRGQGLRILVLVRNFSDIPKWCDKLALFQKGVLSHRGNREVVIPIIAEHLAAADRILLHCPPDSEEDVQIQELPQDLLVLNNGFARYGNTEIFSGLKLTISQGQHTLVTGPNGCGKSSLLQIITGDNPKCYANDLTLFGIRRGTGESIWS